MSLASGSSSSYASASSCTFPEAGPPTCPPWKCTAAPLPRSSCRTRCSTRLLVSPYPSSMSGVNRPTLFSKWLLRLNVTLFKAARRPYCPKAIPAQLVPLYAAVSAPTSPSTENGEFSNHCCPNPNAEADDRSSGGAFLTACFIWCERLCLAIVAQGVRALGNCLWLFPSLARPRAVGTHSRNPPNFCPARGRATNPTPAAILDSQTVSSADHAGTRGYDDARKPRGANAIFWWTPWYVVWVCVLRPISPNKVAPAGSLVGRSRVWLVALPLGRPSLCRFGLRNLGGLASQNGHLAPGGGATSQRPARLYRAGQTLDHRANLWLVYETPPLGAKLRNQN